MKALRRLCATFVLTLALSLSAFAGEIQTTGQIDTTVTGDIATGVTGNMETTITGNMETGITGEMPGGYTTTDPATDSMLSLVQSLLSVF
jgi:hypothetical protein